MTEEEDSILRLIFSTGFFSDDPGRCGADLIRDWLSKFGRINLGVQQPTHQDVIACSPYEAFQALAKFYLEHREAS